MFNQKVKKINEVPSKEKGVELIGEVIDNKIITNIEHNGQIRVLPAEKYDKWEDAIPKWKKRYEMVGLQSHPGQLLDQHESEELYEKINEQGLL